MRMISGEYFIVFWSSNKSEESGKGKVYDKYKDYCAAALFLSVRLALLPRSIDA